MLQQAVQFDHERLDVYRVAIEFVAWVDTVIGPLDGQLRHTRDQLIRSAQSIPLNIAEGNGKRASQDRRRFFEIARGSATESAAAVDVLAVRRACTEQELAYGKQLLFRIVSMLAKLAPPE